MSFGEVEKLWKNHYCYNQFHALDEAFLNESCAGSRSGCG